ncbi:FecR domain-containing protein [Luteolibacter luteus]|uniref:FecR domain-containing protein n=1 Tax=Luteolibacter luteus TaxID=2728835 RepID=A0A858RJE6_9BACT|nr:FecR domain-containing protein [Luteolibacter luteus]QJE96330.1 FecR domain-containing protein [Luteolibacter luteus]
MAAEIPDEFIELLEALSEERIDEAGRARLVSMVREDASLRAVLREHFAVSRALASLERDDPGFAERTAAHVMKTAEEGEFAFAGKVTRRIARHRFAKGLAAAAVLTLAALPLAWKMLHPAKDVATLVRMDEAGIVLSRTPVKAGEKLTETSGLIRLDFHNGAVVAVEAPAKLTTVSGMEIALESGRLNAWCPESAHGFKVRTKSAELTDLGTSFGISASPDGRSEFVVLDGLVEVQKGSEKIRLEQGKALTSNAQDTLQSVAFDPSGFKNTWPLASGILSTTGSVIPASPDVPEKVALSEDSEHVLVIPERRGIPFTSPLEAEIIGPGSLPGTFDGSAKTMEPQAGRRLRSILLRYDPVGTSPEDYFIRLEGEVTFDRPVLAISCLRESLEKSDGVFSTASWTATHRGIELKQIDNDPDSVTLSEDRRTVKIIFYAGASTDEIRVFLED